MSIRSAALVLAAALFTATGAQAQTQTYLMMPDSTNNRVALFDPTTGALVNEAYFALAGGTPVHAMQVGNEIWVSEQIGDRVSRWSLTGESLGAITGGMDNIRGMGVVGNVVYVTNAGTNNGAPGANAVVMFDTAGTSQGNFLTTGLCNSPFGILPHQGGILISGSSNNQDVHRFTLTGDTLGTFHNTTSISFAEQLDHDLNGDVLVACFTTGGVSRLNKDTGDLIDSIPAPGARGVHQLPNGDVMWTSGAGVFVWDHTANVSNNVYVGGGRYLDFLTIGSTPACGTSDFNGDGDFGTDQDIEAFFACLAGNCCATCWQGGSDFNGDGDFGTDQDIESFFRVLGGGNC